MARDAGIPVSMNNAYRDRLTPGTQGRPGLNPNSLHRAGLAFDINWEHRTPRQREDFTSLASEYGFLALEHDRGHYEARHGGATRAERDEADRSYRAGECADASVEAIRAKGKS